MHEAVSVRQGGPGDLPRVAEIQEQSPGAARWDVDEYLDHDFRVIERTGRVAGFAVVRLLCPGESELLNLAIAPEYRRAGLGRRLVAGLAESHPGSLYLEVRESNLAALRFYQTLGFQEVGRRPGYYQNPPEAALVMKLS